MAINPNLSTFQPTSPTLIAQGNELQKRAQNDGTILFYLDDEDAVTGFLGNFHIHQNQNGTESKIKAPDHLLYRCSEAAFQAMKFPPHFHQQFTTADGQKAFDLRNQIGQGQIVAGWLQNRYSAMLHILRNKFNPQYNPELAWLLEQTGNAHLIEHNKKSENETTWSDAIYGNGHNVLGKMLEQVRRENRTCLLENVVYHHPNGTPNLPIAKNDPNISHYYSPGKPHEIACEVFGCMRPKNTKFPGTRACGVTHVKMLQNTSSSHQKPSWQCEVSNCTRPKDKNFPGTRACGISHVKQLNQSNGSSQKPSWQCEVPNCNRPKDKNFPGTRACGISHVKLLKQNSGSK